MHPTKKVQKCLSLQHHLTCFEYKYFDHYCLLLIIDYLLEHANLYKKAHGLNHPFSTSTRLKLLSLMLKEMNLDYLKSVGSVKFYFPLHEDEKREVNRYMYLCTWFLGPLQLSCLSTSDVVMNLHSYWVGSVFVIKLQELKRYWLSFSSQPWQQPIEDVKEYFGEKVRRPWAAAVAVVAVVFCCRFLLFSFLVYLGGRSRTHKHFSFNVIVIMQHRYVPYLYSVFIDCIIFRVFGVLHKGSADFISWRNHHYNRYW